MIYYANPGFNELLVNPTKKSDTNIDKKKYTIQYMLITLPSPKLPIAI